MFSKFSKNLKTTIPDETIDLRTLVELTKNPSKEQIAKISHLRILKKLDKVEYDLKKTEMPHITPACVVRKRTFKTPKDFQKNFIQSSGYVYFDIDDCENLDLEKEFIIQTYGSMISFLTTSIGGTGIGFLVKTTNPILSPEEYLQTRNYLAKTYFQGLKLDDKPKDFGRAMMLSFDPTVFVNYTNEIHIDQNDLRKFINENPDPKNSISKKEQKLNSTYKYSYFMIPPPHGQEQKLKLESEITIQRKLVDYFPAEFLTAKVLWDIKDTKKHKCYTKLIHILNRLNPDIHPYYLYRYLEHINSNYANPKMERRTLIRLFDFVYSSIRNNEKYEFKAPQKKLIHFNPNIPLTKQQKDSIRKKIVGFLEREITVSEILEVKRQLKENGIKVTQKRISENLRYSLTTVKKYYRIDDPLDFEKFLNELNSDSFINTLGINFQPDLQTNSIDTDSTPYFHPNCPTYIKEYYFKSKFNYSNRSF